MSTAAAESLATGGTREFGPFERLPPEEPFDRMAPVTKDSDEYRAAARGGESRGERPYVQMPLWLVQLFVGTVVAGLVTFITSEINDARWSARMETKFDAMVAAAASAEHQKDQEVRDLRSEIKSIRENDIELVKTWISKINADYQVLKDRDERRGR